MSCPARGTWIEIIERTLLLSKTMSCPARGTWIEMQKLAWLRTDRDAVVPRKGHVD